LPFKSKLQSKQRDLLAKKLAEVLSNSAIATSTRSTAPKEATVFGPSLIKRLVFEINESPCLYCSTLTGCVVPNHKRSICFDQDVQVAYDLLTESEIDRADRKTKDAQSKAAASASRLQFRQVASIALQVAARVDKRKQDDKSEALKSGIRWIQEVSLNR
jgi:hypothetical protein